MKMVAVVMALLVAAQVVFPPAVAASPKTVVIPAVEGRVVDEAGAPLQHALVVATFIGSHQPVGHGDGDVVKLCVTHALTDAQGVFMLSSETFPLRDAEGKRVHFIGARIEFSHQQYRPLQLNLANVSGSSSGVMSVFLTAAIEHDGGFFGALAAGWHAVKGTTFVTTYEAALHTDVTLSRTTAATAPAEPPQARRIRLFGDLYAGH